METQTVEVARIVEISNMPAVSIKDVLAIKAGAIELTDQVNTLAVKDQASADVMNLSLMKLNKVIKFIDELRLEATKDLRDGVILVNTQIKEKAAPFVESFAAGKLKLDTYRKEQQAIIDTENARIAEENRKAEEVRLKEIARRKAISDAQGGDGSNIKPVDEVAPVKQVQPLSVTDSTKTFRHLVVEVIDVTKVEGSYLNNDKVKDAIRQETARQVQVWLSYRGGLAKIKLKDLPAIPGIKLSIESRSKF